jgi:hypothetical protein
MLPVLWFTQIFRFFFDHPKNIVSSEIMELYVLGTPWFTQNFHFFLSHEKLWAVQITKLLILITPFLAASVV